MTAPSATQLRLREHHVFLALTILVGVLAGLSAVLFTVAIDRATRILFGLDPSAARLFLVPAVGQPGHGLAAESGVSRRPRQRRAADRGRVSPARRRHSGPRADREVPHRRAVHRVRPLDGPRRPVRPDRRRSRVVDRPVAAAVAGPASRSWCRSAPPARSRRRSTRPVAAVLFALEEIIGDMNATLLGSTVVASVASVVVERSILGNEPLFRVPTYHLEHPAELLGVRRPRRGRRRRLAGLLQGPAAYARRSSSGCRCRPGSCSRRWAAWSSAVLLVACRRSWGSATSTSIRRSTAACC